MVGIEPASMTAVFCRNTLLGEIRELPVVRVAGYPLATFLWLAVVLPGKLGDATRVEKLSSLPMGTYRDKPLRSLVLDTFDRLSAPVEHRFVWADLIPWFAESGLVVDAHRDESGWFVVAHRPAG